MRREELKDVLKAKSEQESKQEKKPPDFGILNYNNKTKAKKVKKAQQEGLCLHKEGQQEGSEEAEQPGTKEEQTRN